MLFIFRATLQDERYLHFKGYTPGMIWSLRVSGGIWVHSIYALLRENMMQLHSLVTVHLPQGKKKKLKKYTNIYLCSHWQKNLRDGQLQWHIYLRAGHVWKKFISNIFLTNEENKGVQREVYSFSKQSIKPPYYI